MKFELTEVAIQSDGQQKQSKLYLTF